MYVYAGMHGDVDIGRIRSGNELILIETWFNGSCCRQLLSDHLTSRGIVDTEQFFETNSPNANTEAMKRAPVARSAVAMFRRPTVRHVGTLLLQSNLV